MKYPIDYNLEAIKTLIRRAMEMGFYEGVNLSLHAFPLRNLRHLGIAQSRIAMHTRIGKISVHAFGVGPKFVSYGRA